MFIAVNQRIILSHHHLQFDPSKAFGLSAAAKLVTKSLSQQSSFWIVRVLGILRHILIPKILKQIMLWVKMSNIMTS
jgi:hypothetical protein